jgi:hypothetical protein
MRGDRLLPASSVAPAPVISIIQSENIFDLGQSIRVLIVDKPLTGDLVPELESTVTDAPIQSGGGPSEYLSHSPMLENDFFDKIERLRKTYILCPGYETHFATRIKDLSLLTANQLVRYLPTVHSFELVNADIERVAYTTLHSLIFSHLTKSLGESSALNKNCTKDMTRLETVLREAQAPVEIITNLKAIVPFISGIIVPELAKFNLAITPQQKINYLILVVEKLTSIFREMAIQSVSSEHLLAGMILSIICADMTKGHIHAAHISMFLSVHPELAMEKGSFAFATFNSCIEYLRKAVLP